MAQPAGRPRDIGILAANIAGLGAAALVLVLFLALPFPSMGAPPEELPAAVKQYIANLDHICRQAGGVPGESATAVKLIDLTQDGVGDYLINGASYKCGGAESALADNRQRTPIAIFVIMPQTGTGKSTAKTTERPAGTSATKSKGKAVDKATGKSAVKAFETVAYGVTIETDGVYPRLLIQQAAADCAATGPVQQPLDKIKFCARPLDWDAEKQGFILALPSKGQPIQ
ncbi:MAG TPA: hypothetical protein VM639_23225 [Dongiaceae bacterium]|nr:hypothetical protein [Dongiaceae bacterium]